MNSNFVRRWRQQNWVMLLILVVQLLVFAGETFSGGSESGLVLVNWGAKYDPLIRIGEWWRLITPVFVHIGFMHILVNSFTLYYIGGAVEEMIGHWRFFLVYFLSALSGNLMSFAFGGGALSAGASTALFGLFGVYIALGVVFDDSMYYRQTGRQFLMLAAFNLVFDLFAQGIDIWGHIGGLLGGFLLIIVFALPGQKLRKGVYWQIGASVLFLAICAFLYWLGMVR
ncbi:rhomboid family intramembrane serine protease [Lapidilactobacillus mulanensis]|uniref:Rhomboid family intramembrane serine protease n=1 Tax=Lapidilactobacillus mulanensis TaxID=2485999 RepID=A0ABW4DR47_9LACO|nr:rhomboid family intramembrane serine protease [Lapidilactobacillus mulanensis]